MSASGLASFQHTLQEHFRPDDQTWSYTVPNLPRAPVLDSQGLIKSIAVVSNNSKQHIILRFTKVSANRAIANEPLSSFISISFSDFRLRFFNPELSQNQDPGVNGPTLPTTAKESADYMVRLLRSGLTLNGVHYNFYGHSNSQLKSRTCILFADSRDAITCKVENLGEFSKIKTVAKKAKRIGLLFSAAEMAMNLQMNRCEDIPDIKTKEYNFTDGCGLISPNLAKLLVKGADIKFRNRRYLPSVFQIRYRGYKGVLMLEPSMKNEKWVKFRESMKKFESGEDLSFSVIDFSKPYGFGYLNDEIVLLLHSLEIPAAAFLSKQEEHLSFLRSATLDSRMSFRFLSYVNRLDLAERVLMEGLDTVRPLVKKLVNQEYNRMLNKRDEQRCRILIPKSRLLFGICDSQSVLREGECAVKVTMDGDGQPRALTGMEVLVTRNPCLHPGDLQKFKVVEKPELAHLVDCIIFPTRGKRPSADMMSGGDLDGDTFFVSWDRDLIPPKLSQPAHYQGIKEPLTFKPITDENRLEYFARYTSASLGRVKNLYLDWARLNGPLSRECQELNFLFSNCVDGNHIKVPKHLEDPPKALFETPFILDTLHDAAKAFINAQQRSSQSCDGFSFDAMQILLCRDDVAMSEFEAIQLSYRWCMKNDASLAEFLDYFDFNQLSDDEKTWTIGQLPVSVSLPSLIVNSLVSSKLLAEEEIRPFKLNYPNIRWKCVFDSDQDRLARFYDFSAQIMELFHKKLMVLKIDERLTIAIYIPRKIEKRKNCQVDDSVRLFAFPHSQGDETFHRRVVPTKRNYRLYCDDHGMRLYEGQHANTWVYVGQPGASDSLYRNIENQGDKRRKRHETVSQGLNHDCIISVALDKFSKGLQRHVGRVNRNPVLGAELYVISNRDIRSLQTLDLWLESIDTQTIVPLFERQAREYSLPTMSEVDWSMEPDYLRRIAKVRDFSIFATFDSPAKFANVFEWLWNRDEKGLLRSAFEYLLGRVREGVDSIMAQTTMVQAMLTFLVKAPPMAITFIRLQEWASLHPSLRSALGDSAPNLLGALILAANEARELIVAPFKCILGQVQYMSLTSFSELVELISLTIRSCDVALDILLGSLESDSSRFLVGRPTVIRHFVRNLIGIALEHINEANESSTAREELLQLNVTDEENIVCSRLRIDSQKCRPLAQSDHVRLKTASSPGNSVTERLYFMDALVKKSDRGSVTFQCLHPVPRFVEDCSWEVVNCGSFVTSRSMFEAVKSLAIEAEDCCVIYEQLFGLSQNNLSSEDKLCLYSPRKNLNDSQNKAVNSSLNSPLTCLWGPPGTGKTHTIVVILQELLLEPGYRILVSAPTHNAVDNVMRKFLATSGSQDSSFNPIRVSTDVRKVADDLRAYTCDAMLGTELHESFRAQKEAKKRIRSSRLIFTTCIGASLGLLRQEKFNTVIIDEAAQQTEPMSLVPLVKGCSKAILVGDHVQLRATVTPPTLSLQFDVSLFERLYQQDSRGGTLQKVMLDTQYRMHREICAFSAREFYDNRLATAVPDASRPLPESAFPWPPSRHNPTDKARAVFVPCSTPEDLGQKSKSNKGQASLCQKICSLLLTLPLPSIPPPPPSNPSPNPNTNTPPPIAVLTPYTRQADLLRDLLLPSTSVVVSTIDGFQGREADVVVFVTVRANVHGELGFLRDMRRLNVVMTRARCGVVVVGDGECLRGEGGSLKGEGEGEEGESRGVWRRLVRGLVRVGVEVGEV